MSNFKTMATTTTQYVSKHMQALFESQEKLHLSVVDDPLSHDGLTKAMLKQY